ncbi:Starch-binding associating with outer membrane [Flavobacterium aquidurense]|uniref:RagB/SusD family nutrient uptake outer membrane protein n=1 Tax=Flavobacterium frigidimaris TaxID=262320 RepID=A0ABX4BJH6_FLAFR|nr:RagB/SusD family nutrient uptake outer membrane protein [Flavobacterium frigidimaris]OXA75172.1 RagB/SusD family nutrient uptake outer membrane protein [Flavobacterium frigidimaris]SDZ66647.1 Starch-binding associating with outer membrane [Flavobacterium aquidurense]
MKKYIYLMASALLFALTSCDDELNQLPLSQGTIENFYATPGDFVQARNATYSIAFHGAGTYGYANRVLNLSETRSDNLYATTTASRDWEGINSFYTSISSNTYVREAYTSNYNAIYKANQLLEKIAEKGDAIFTTPADKTSMIAEARFLRAFCYFDLIRWFGKVPLIDRTMTAQEASKIGRSPVAKVYELIISDLQLAIPDLSPAYDAANFGRVTKYGAKSLLGLVYMTRSSPTYGIDGAMLGLNEWDKAYKELNDIKASGLFAFSADYDPIFKLEGLLNKENVLTIPYTQNISTPVGGNFMVEVGYEPYFASVNLSAQGALEAKPISTGFMNMFAATDKRKIAGIATSYTVASGTYKGSYTLPVFKKYIDPTRYGNGREDWGVDFMVTRYTDVLMLMAECTLHGGGGTQADVDAIVNQVRTRAGVPANAVNINLDQLFDERRKEFFSEGTRWFDLIRSGKAVTIMNTWRIAEDTGNKIRTIDNNSLLYPIPLQEILAVPGLYEQNPGYD